MNDLQEGQKHTMNDIDQSLRVLQNYLKDLKSNLGYMAEQDVAEAPENPEVPTKFSDEGEPTIPGIYHMVSKANIHAKHCVELIHKIRGDAPLDETPEKG